LLKNWAFLRRKNMIRKITFILLFSLFFIPVRGFSYQKTMPLTDKEIIERLTRLEEGQKALEKEQKMFREEMNERFKGIDKRFEGIDKRFEDIDKRFEDINKRFEDIDKRFEQIDKRFEEIDQRITDLVHTANTMMVVFGGLVVAMMGLVFWDRRTLIEKAKEVTVRHIETESRVIKVLKELSKSDKKLAEVLRSFGLL